MTFCRPLYDLDRVQMVNYDFVNALDDPSEEYLVVEMFFSSVNSDQTSMMINDVKPEECITFNIEYDDMEEFVAEIRLNIELCRTQHTEITW